MPLPGDVWQQILELLEVQECLALILTCKAWADVLVPLLYVSPRLTSPSSLGAFLKALSQTSTTTFYPYAKFVEALVLPSALSDDLLLGDLDRLLAHCENLSELSLASCPHLSNLLVSSLSVHVPRLRRLTLKRSGHISETFLLKLLRGCPGLRQLDLTAAHVSLSTLPLILSNGRALEELTLSQIVGEIPVSKEPLLPLLCPSLKYLDLSSTRITDEDLVWIAQAAPSLASLSLSDCPLITDDGIYKLSMHCTRLKVLDLSNNETLTGASLQALEIFAASTLEVLVLLGTRSMSPSSVQKLQSACLPRTLSVFVSK